MQYYKLKPTCIVGKSMLKPTLFVGTLTLRVVKKTGLLAMRYDTRMTFLSSEKGDVTWPISVRTLICEK